MTNQEFIEQQIKLGFKLHQNDGVWWQQTKGKYFCKPANIFQQLKFGAAKPAYKFSPLGYSYLLSGEVKGNTVYSVMGLVWTQERTFGMDDISASRRSKVRRGEKKIEVKQLTSLEPYLEDIRQTVISARERTGAGLPASYYTTHKEEWTEDMLQRFKMRDRPLLAAFFEGKLIAYFYLVLIDDIMIIQAAKSHSDYLVHYPNDVLVYHALDYAFNERKCRFVVYGDWAPGDKNLNYFKESYGFKKYDFPMYRHLNPIAKLALHLKNLLGI